MDNDSDISGNLDLDDSDSAPSLPDFEATDNPYG